MYSNISHSYSIHIPIGIPIDIATNIPITSYYVAIIPPFCIG